MKLVKTAILASLVCGLNLISLAQSPANISVIPEKPVQGEHVQINYEPANGIGANENIKGIIYLFENYQWRTDDLSLKKAGTHWASEYKLPEDCGFFALKFVGDSISDTNNQTYGYVWFVQSKSGGFGAGAYAAWGLMRSPGYGYTIPDYFDLSKSGISDSVTFFWLNQEISYHQKKAAPVLAFEYAKSLKKSEMADGPEKIQRCLNYLFNNPTEKNLLTAESIYRSILEDPAKADSVRQINVRKFPSGAINRLAAYRKAFSERDMDTRFKLLADFLKQYPQKPEDDQFNQENMISYDNIYLNFLLLEISRNNYDAVYEYVPKFSLTDLMTVYYKAIEVPHKRKDKTDEFLYPYAKYIIDRIQTLKGQKPDRYRFLSPGEWLQEFERIMAGSIWVDHTNLLRNSGHNSEAMDFALRAQKTLDYTVADLNDDLCHLFQEAGKTEEMNDVLRKSMYNNQVSPYMIDLMKQAYVRKNGSETGFNAYLESLKKPELQRTISERILKDKREGKMPEWEMTDASGKKISSNDLLGKTYVLDFWASWCVPCKASFPGMKLAVERYQDDPDVAFFFVDTEEQSARYKEMANKYIADNNFPFHILFDNKPEGGKANDEIFSLICKEFRISGIPQKIFVDRNGNVRFISVGYKGSPSELSDDISIMVEETKKAAAQ